MRSPIEAKTRLVVLCCAGGVMLGCNDEPEDVIDTSASPTADFTQFRTYAFTNVNDMTPDLAHNIPSTVSADLAVVTDATRQELSELGLTEVDPSASPDLRAFNLASTNNEEGVYWTCIDSYWYGYWYWSWAPCEWITPVYTEYTEGSILLGLVDPDANELVFAGLIQGVIDGSDDIEDRIREDVDEVFDDYPRGQTGQ
jgi:hypothetical protein